MELQLAPFYAKVPKWLIQSRHIFQMIGSSMKITKTIVKTNDLKAARDAVCAASICFVKMAVQSAKNNHKGGKHKTLLTNK